MNLLRYFRKKIGSPVFAEYSLTLHHLDESYSKAQTCIFLFYALQLFSLNQAFHHWAYLRGSSGWIPLWPLSWVNDSISTYIVDFIFLLYSAGILLAILNPKIRSFRLLSFLGIFFYSALENSFGKISHGLHAWLYISFILIFLPQEKNSSKKMYKQKYLSIFSCAQASLLLVYSLAGFWKLYNGIIQEILGEVSTFSIKGFSYVIADRLLQTNSDTVLSGFIIEYPFIGFVLFQLAVYVELFSILIIWRPALHKFWGIALILLHLGSVLTVSVRFSSNILLLCIFFLYSPFTPKKIDIKKLFLDLPLIRFIYRKNIFIS